MPGPRPERPAVAASTREETLLDEQVEQVMLMIEEELVTGPQASKTRLGPRRETRRTGRQTPGPSGHARIGRRAPRPGEPGSRDGARHPPRRDHDRRPGRGGRTRHH